MLEAMLTHRDTTRSLCHPQHIHPEETVLRAVARAFALLVSLALVSAPLQQASAQPSLDLAAWLGRPGVRLVAVEFYATWCKPCMEAVPRWKALHEKYRDQGLRLIVVSTQDVDNSARTRAGARTTWSATRKGSLLRRCR